MKTAVLLFFLPLQMVAQELTGVWTGFIQSSGSKIPYEVVISGTGDKLNGYALTIFTFNGVENMGIKTIELKNKNGSIGIEDHELVYDNYATPPKKVKLIGTLVYTVHGKAAALSGSFFTRSLDLRAQDKQGYTGTIFLQKQENTSITKLTAKLDELQLLQTLSFVAPKPRPTEQPATTALVEEPLPPLKEIQKSFAVNRSGSKVTVSPAIARLPKALVPPEAFVVAGPLPEVLPLPKERSFITVVYKKPAIVLVPVPSRASRRSIVPYLPPPDLAKTSEPLLKPAAAETKSPPVATPPIKAAAALAQRKTEVIQQVAFRSDSLVLSLYDNGTVDGDTVSVVLNGVVLIPRKGLTTTAIRTVVHVTPEMGDSLQLVMYAENLGAIPPNTGLLVVQDGGQRTEVRFAGDYQKSSAIVLRRRR